MSHEETPLWRVPGWYRFLDRQIIEDLKMFHVELLRFSTKINLISQNSKEKADEIHFADSIEAFLLLKKKDLLRKNPIFDMGSGGGFPGLVFGILDRDQHVVLIETRRKKTEFLKHISSVLDLKNVEVVCTKGQDLPPDSVSIAVSRGYGTIKKTLMDFQECVMAGGLYIHFKGRIGERELVSLEECSTWNTYLLGEYSLPETRIGHSLFCSEKIWVDC